VSDFVDGFIAFFALLRDLWLALWPAVVALVGAIWWALETYPVFRVIVLVGAGGFFVYWFYDGVKNWRKKCIPCRGKGFFDSKLSSKLNRPCPCCNGSVAGGGRHPTIRSRIWDNMRGKQR
jgi:hypothetical protein